MARSDLTISVQGYDESDFVDISLSRQSDNWIGSASQEIQFYLTWEDLDVLFELAQCEREKVEPRPRRTLEVSEHEIDYMRASFQPLNDMPTPLPAILLADYVAMQRERDEARAENERLRAERDEARAGADALRARLRRAELHHPASGRRAVDDWPQPDGEGAA